MSEIWEHYTELISDPAHMMVELTFFLVVDLLLIGLLWPIAKKLIHRDIDRKHDVDDNDGLELTRRERAVLKGLAHNEIKRQENMHTSVVVYGVRPTSEGIQVGPDGKKTVSMNFVADGKGPLFDMFWDKPEDMPQRGQAVRVHDENGDPQIMHRFKIQGAWDYHKAGTRPDTCPECVMAARAQAAADDGPCHEPREPESKSPEPRNGG